MIDFDLTDEQKLVRETARDFTNKEVVPRARENDRNHHFDTDLVAKMAEQGYLGAIVPREYGGAGLDYLTYGLIVEEVGRGCSAMRTVISVQTSLVCSSIVRWGTEEQKQHYLPKLCSGEWLGCFGLTEPDTGSDAANQKTRARKTDGGWVDLGQQDVDLDGQLREGRARLRPDRPRARPPRARLLPGPDRLARVLLAGDPREDGPARLRHRVARVRRHRGARRRADGPGRRRLQDRDVGARLGPLLGRRRLRRASARARSTSRSTTRRSASSSTARSRPSSSCRR